MENRYIIYPGRFQPMGYHHVEAYKHLVSKFGDNVFICTTDKVNDLDSPLSFEDKKVIITKMGIPDSKIISTLGGSPYNIEHVTDSLSKLLGKKLNSENDILIFAHGKKDDGRFSYTKKDGTPARYQPYTSGNLLPYNKFAYIYQIPTINISMKDKSQMSGTALRQYLGQCAPEEFKALMGFYDSTIHKKLKNSINGLDKNLIESTLKESTNISISDLYRDFKKKSIDNVKPFKSQHELEKELKDVINEARIQTESERLKYYKQYIKNILPSGFEVSFESGKLIIQEKNNI
jgi:hypothetical protein